MSVQEILAEMGAVLTDNHFVYVSEKHGRNYVAKDVLYTDPRKTSEVCKELAVNILQYCQDVWKLNEVTVVSPAVGGVALSQWVTYHLLELGAPHGFKAYAAFADRDLTPITLSEGEMVKIGDKWDTVPVGASVSFDTGSFVIKRSYGKLVAGKKVVVVEDVLTTGKSAKATVEAVKRAGGEVVMAAAVCNRGGVTLNTLGVPHLYSAVNVNFEMFDSKDCPMCRDKVPVNIEFGHGKKFLAQTGT